MKILMRLSVLMFAVLVLQPLPASAGPFYGGLNVGYTGGLGIQATSSFMDFARDLPLSARFTLGYNSASAGDPYAARQIFINDNTNGDPEKSASTWQFRVDLMFPAFTIGPQTLYLLPVPGTPTIRPTSTTSVAMKISMSKAVAGDDDGDAVQILVCVENPC